MANNLDLKGNRYHIHLQRRVSPEGEVTYSACLVNPFDGYEVCPLPVDEKTEALATAAAKQFIEQSVACQ